MDDALFKTIKKFKREEEINNPIQGVNPIKTSKLEGERRLSFFVKEESHHQLKIISSYNKISIKEMLNEILEKYLLKENKKIEEKFKKRTLLNSENN